MNKILSMFLAGAALMSVTSCSDSSYDEKYADPSETKEAGVPYAFTGVLHQAREWTDFIYYKYYITSPTEGLFSGVVGDNNTAGRFQGAGVGRYDDRWKDFYEVVTQYRLLMNTYENLLDGEKPTNEIFVHCSRAVVYSQLHEMLSLFGDVPFNGAGTLWIDGDYERAKRECVYEDDVELYRQILSDLKASGDYFAQGISDQKTLNSLSRQDYTLAAGSAEMWQKYINSLRLRIALHLATNGDLVSEAHIAIKEILENPNQYPLIESNDDNMGVAGNTSDDDFNYGKSMAQAMRTSGVAAASQTILRVMNVPDGGVPDENTDPRIQAMYDPNPDGEYIAYDNSLTNAEITNIGDQKNLEYIDRGILNANYYCEVDTQAIAGWKEYEGNTKLNTLWIGAAEVSLSKAEAYLMGYGVAADQNKAKEYFIQGVEQSCEYYWNMKTTSSLYNTKEANDSYASIRPLDVKTSEDFKAYAEKIWKPTQETICEQLWLNYSFVNEHEAWNVVRRTGYPVVYFSQDKIMTTYPTPPHRLPYVNDELNFNSDNVQQAIQTNCGGDNTVGGFYTPLFWAKSDYYKMID